MTHPFFFGYGSLVNRATHIYDNAHRARITGWRRSWRHIAAHPVSLLTGVADANSTIDGLIAEVPNGDWAALDARESGYLRHETKAVSHELPHEPSIAIYAVPDEKPPAPTPAPIILSYLDVVVRGYLHEFGERGVADFFATTDGWDRNILDDRADPKYPRAQVLTADEMSLVTDHATRLTTIVK